MDILDEFIEKYKWFVKGEYKTLDGNYLEAVSVIALEQLRPYIKMQNETIIDSLESDNAKL